jgi:hypothetical protein
MSENLLGMIAPAGLIDSHDRALRLQIAAELEAAADPASALFNEHHVKGLLFAAKLVRAK